MVIDTITSLCQDFLAQGNMKILTSEIFERNSFLKQIIVQMKKIAYKYKIVVITVNNMTSSLKENFNNIIENEGESKVYLFI